MPSTQLIVAIGGVALVLVTAYGLWRQNGQWRRSQADDFLWRAVERWNSDEMKARRVLVATAFQNGSERTADTTALFNYLEFFAYFVHAGTIEEVGAWTVLGDFAVGYWTVGGAAVDLQRADQMTVYTEWAYLVDRINKIEAKERQLNVPDVKWNKFDHWLTRFITIESIQRKFDVETVAWTEDDMARFLRNEIAMNAPLK
ncbi:MAG TPA: hypothetical protein VNF75_05545 [Candidatus Dormibacteraeota bacterium]|nr:hypothetical protein [Candidatus Dormibacteraeota bacterium]